MIAFVTGGTGYLGRPLIARLLERGHAVRALARAGSETRLPSGTQVVTGNALDSASWAGQVAPAETFVHLVGTPRPNPSKAREFREVDLASIRAGITAAERGGVRHFVYVSVAQPAPVMKAYIEVRAEGEALVRASGLDATILRPWYVLGPGHWWPYLLLPMYGILSLVPSTADSARRLGLVTRARMIAALVRAVEEPPRGVRIVEVPEIRRA
jgi:uncharacterized protein YbjT (DUF2867 family)